MAGNQAGEIYVKYKADLTEYEAAARRAGVIAEQSSKKIQEANKAAIATANGRGGGVGGIPTQAFTSQANPYRTTTTVPAVAQAPGTRAANQAYVESQLGDLFASIDTMKGRLSRVGQRVRADKMDQIVRDDARESFVSGVGGLIAGIITGKAAFHEGQKIGEEIVQLRMSGRTQAEYERLLNTSNDPRERQQYFQKRLDEENAYRENRIRLEERYGPAGEFYAMATHLRLESPQKMEERIAGLQSSLASASEQVKAQDLAAIRSQRRSLAMQAVAEAGRGDFSLQTNWTSGSGGTSQGAAAVLSAIAARVDSAARGH